MKSLSQRINEKFNEAKMSSDDYSQARAYLGELWFAQHGKETSEFKKIGAKLDKLKVPFAVQNEVAKDASDTTKKAVDTTEVQDRIAKILKKHNINESLNESQTIGDFKPTEHETSFIVDAEIYYLKKVDGGSTHFDMYSPFGKKDSDRVWHTKGLSQAIHIGQRRGEPYIKDVISWMKGSLSSKEMFGRIYDGATKL